MGVPRQSFMSDVLFDNIFSDLDMRDRVRESMAGLSRAHQNLVRELQAADQRISSARAEVNQAKDVLDEKRRELQHIRAAAFERFAGEGRQASTHEFASAPPAYSA